MTNTNSDDKPLNLFLYKNERRHYTRDRQTRVFRRPVTQMSERLENEDRVARMRSRLKY